jgi:quinoprotein glucose dehydrogenase
MINCGLSGLNIPTPAVADPTTNIMYASHTRRCGTSGFLAPTNGVDEEVTVAIPGTTETPTTGRTVVPWLPGGDDPGMPEVEGLPVYKPLNALAAIDLNTGRKLWDIPLGPTPDDIRNHPALQGMQINTGSGGGGIQMVVGDLLLHTSGGIEGEDGQPLISARNKRTGEIIAQVELPAGGQYGMMTFMHEGKQYIVVNSAGGPTGMPGGYVALTLP